VPAELAYDRHRSAAVDHLLVAQRYVLQCTADDNVYGAKCHDKVVFLNFGIFEISNFQPITSTSFTPRSSTFVGASSLTGLYEGGATELHLDDIDLKTMRLAFRA